MLKRWTPELQRVGQPWWPQQIRFEMRYIVCNTLQCICTALHICIGLQTHCSAVYCIVRFPDNANCWQSSGAIKNSLQYLHQFKSNIFQGHHKLVRTLLQHVKTDVNTRDNQGKSHDDEFDNYHHNYIMVCAEHGGEEMWWQWLWWSYILNMEKVLKS